VSALDPDPGFAEMMEKWKKRLFYEFIKAGDTAVSFMLSFDMKYFCQKNRMAMDLLPNAGKTLEG
jgi:hypothetical protein